MMQTLMERFERIELTGTPQYVASIQFTGLKHLQVGLTPRRAAA